MAGGGKGGSKTTEVEIPQWLERAAQQNLARADEIATLGYVPRFGPEVAAFSPMQQAAFANTGQAAGAFGLPGGGMTGMEGMPAPTQFAGGVQGYSSTPLYNEMVSALQANAPGQYDFIRGMFIDPTTGAGPRNPFAPLTGGASAYGGGLANNSLFASHDPYDDGSNSYDPFAGASLGGFQDPNLNGSAGYGAGGYTSFGDRIDGGGPGQSGGAFEGGVSISDIANAVIGRQ